MLFPLFRIPFFFFFYLVMHSVFYTFSFHHWTPSLNHSTSSIYWFISSQYSTSFLPNNTLSQPFQILFLSTYTHPLPFYIIFPPLPTLFIPPGPPPTTLHPSNINSRFCYHSGTLTTLQQHGNHITQPPPLFQNWNIRPHRIINLQHPFILTAHRTICITLTKTPCRFDTFKQKHTSSTPHQASQHHRIIPQVSTSQPYTPTAYQDQSVI